MILCTFRSLNDCPLAMTAHVVFEDIDPQRPATTSPKVIRDIIRGEIGFEGVLMSDDLSMNALKVRSPFVPRRRCSPAATSFFTATEISTRCRMWRRKQSRCRIIG